MSAVAQPVEDSTHVWLSDSENFQTACTALNTALDAANTDGWLYVWGGTHTVTAPLLCNGASNTERMHIICMGGYPGISTGTGSGCRILPVADAASDATMKIAHTDLQGFYIEADADTGDHALQITNSAEVHRNSLSNPNSASAGIDKSVIRILATGATTPVVSIEDNYLYLYCDAATTECGTNSAAIWVAMGESGGMTDNTHIVGNVFELAGNTAAVPNNPSPP